MARRVRIDLPGNDGVSGMAQEGFDVVELPAPNEHALQEIVKAHPNLLPADDLGFDGDLAVVGRETTLASGAIDLLCLARSGDLVLVEFKTGPQNPDFRHALAQVIDYGSDLWGRTVEDFDRGVVQRYLTSSHSSAPDEVSDLMSLIESTWRMDDSERDSLMSRLAEVLQTGDFTFVVAAQRFVPAMRASVDFLNSTSRFGKYFLAEVVRLEGAGAVAHLAQVVAAPSGRASGTTSAAGQVNEAIFLESLPDPSFREAMRDIFSAADSLGLQFGWGTTGTSIRLVTIDRAEPLSIGWAFPEGKGMYGAKHLTLGVGRSSLESTPSVTEAVEQYLARLAAIRGGEKVSNPSGYMFTPAVVVSVKDELIEALTKLSSEAGGESEPSGAQE